MRTGGLFSYVDLEDRVRRDHPLRTIRLIVNEALASLEWEFAPLPFSDRVAIDLRTTRHPGYGVSLRIRKQIEEAFGWIKTIAGQNKTKFRGRDRVGWAFSSAAAACDLVWLPKLLAASP